jgi:hypothetical protein
MMRISRRVAMGSLAVAALTTLSAIRWPASNARRRLLLIDGSLSEDDIRDALQGLHFVASHALAPDLVQQWRSALQRDVLIHAGSVTALVRWDKSIVLSGLAREAALPVSQRRLSRSLFRIDIES